MYVCKYREFFYSSIKDICNIGNNYTIECDIYAGLYLLVLTYVLISPSLPCILHGTFLNSVARTRDDANSRNVLVRMNMNLYKTALCLHDRSIYRGLFHTHAYSILCLFI